MTDLLQSAIIGFITFSLLYSIHGLPGWLYLFVTSVILFIGTLVVIWACALVDWVARTIR
jgi:hypothetical protein